MRYLSLFSGIEACTVAWHPLGWEPAAFCEIEPGPCKVLAHHYPDVPNLGDVTQISDEQIEALGPIDLVVGGSPCQDLSVAGKRAGLAGERSGLFHEQMRIFHAARTLCGARWLLWENVPGAFSSNGGADFGAVVGAMVGATFDAPPAGWANTGASAGPGGLVEWVVLDAQWFGVPQRRRRVFAFLDTGDWQSRPPVLFDAESLRGDSPPRREAGERIADSLTVGANQCLGRPGDFVEVPPPICRASGASNAETLVDKSPTLTTLHDGPPFIAFHNRHDPDVSGDVTHPLGAKDNGMAIAFKCNASNDFPTQVEVSETLQAMNYEAVAFKPSHYTRGKDGAPSEVTPPLSADADKGDQEPVVAVRTANTGANGHGVAEDVAHTLDGANGQAVAYSIMPMNSGKDYKARETEVAQPIMGSGPTGGNQGGDYVVVGGVDGEANPVEPDGSMGCLNVTSSSGGGHKPAVAFAQNQSGELGESEVHPQLTCGGGNPGEGYAAARTGYQVRRLTPLECSRLQGFDDKYLDIPGLSDTAKYRALGNSMAVPVMRWIGGRIAEVMQA